MLKFNPLTHTYTVDGVVDPGPNDVLNCVGVRSKCSECHGEGTIDSVSCSDCKGTGYTSYNSLAGGEFARDKTASRFGNEFHKIAKYTLQCKNFTYDKTFEPWVRGLNKFLIKFGITPISIEEPLFHPIYKYCGTPDLFGYYYTKNPHDKIYVVVDWKTSVAAMKHWKIVMAAYAELIKFNLQIKKKIHRLSVMIMPETYKVIEHKDAGDFNEFLSILNVYKRYRK